MFAMNFLANSAEPGAAISKLGQIRIESPVPQPSGFSKISAPKDLVVWNNSFETSWDNNWNAIKYPGVVLEWKMKRTGEPPEQFDSHDVTWLSGFTEQFHNTYGYLIRVYCGPHGRAIDWAKVRQGVISGINKRSWQSHADASKMRR